MMTPKQGLELRRLLDRLEVSEGQALALAREAAHNGGLVHLGQLTARDAGELILTLHDVANGRARLESIREQERELLPA